MENKISKLDVIIQKVKLRSFIKPVLLWLLLACQASLFAQKETKTVSLSLKNTNAAAILQEVKKQSSVQLIYSPEELQTLKLNEFIVHKVSVKEALDQLCKKLPLEFVALKSGFAVRKRTTADEMDQVPVNRAAPTGKISLKGRVVDFETSEPLVGATVNLQGVGKTTLTDEKGYYSFSNLGKQEVAISVSYAGYANFLESVKLHGNETFDVKMQAGNGQTLTDVLITTAGKKVRTVTHTTDKQIVTSIKNMASVVSGISSEQISKSADRNASEAVRKISGVSVRDDKFIVIRGMNERYNLTYLNGNIAPSTELYSRAFALDLLPSRIIDRILVYKSPAPDLMADMTGGAVKIFTKDAVNVKHFDVELQLGYRSNTTFNDRFLTNKGSGTDFLGFDNGLRKLPAVLPGYGDFTRAQISQKSYAQHFNPNLNYGYTHGLPTMQLTVNYYNGIKIGGRTLNTLTSLSYKNESQQMDVERTKSQNTDGERFHSTSSETQGTQTAQITLLQNFTYRLRNKGSIAFKNYLLQQGQNGTVLRTTKTGQRLPYGKNQDYDFSKLGNLPWEDDAVGYRPYERNIILSYTQRFLYSGNLTGSHPLQQNKGNLDWNLGYTYSRQQIPDQRLIRLSKNRGREIGYAKLPTDSNLNWVAAFRHVIAPDEETADNSVERGIVSRTWTQNSENLYNASADYTFKWKPWVTVKAGTYQQWKQRILFRRVYRLNEGDLNSVGYADNAYAAIGSTSPNMDISKVFFFQQDLNRVWSTDYLKDDGSALKVFDATSGSDAYTATEQLNTGYAAVSLLPFKGKLDIYGGLRVEYDRQRVSSAVPASYQGGVNRPVLADNKSTDYLPSVNIGYRPSEQLVFRFAFGKTVNRPEFRELSPYTELDYLNNQYVKGNYLLKSARVDNYDARIELYPKNNNKGETFSIGAFYKELKSPIERTIAQSLYSNSPIVISYANADKAIVRGLEIDLRKNLGFIPVSFFQKLSVIGNVSFINSTVNKTLDTSVLKNPDPKVNPHYTRQLQGQAPYVANLGLFYDNAGLGTRVAVTWNVIGPRIYAAANGVTAAAVDTAKKLFYPTPGDLGSTIELERQTLDLAVTQRIIKSLQLKFSVQNLLDQQVRMAEDENFSYKYEKAGYNSNEVINKRFTGDLINNQYRYGRHFILSLLYSF